MAKSYTVMDIINLSANNRQKVLKQAASALASSKNVICPTDTVYGLLANATDNRAVAKVYRIKQRDPNKPLPVFLESIEAAEAIAAVSPGDQKKLRAAWPGKTTFVLDLKPGIDIPAAEGKKIALRVPSHEFLLDLLKMVNFPVTATSANIAGSGPYVEIADVLAEFKIRNEQPDLVIDAGNLPPTKPSTIVDLTDNEKILRP
ncbi:MAG TPA: L-threonylcarbamoyladenylate synthase [Candidatus Paceibacterota bacterium]|nr:L-threonylcarbamoyladenylate synthase [Candidatus Pacearchaeota archaeon]HRZ51283.1 L-threonylcarbamoyladenylate synthase [Candidatus Paceibacterota bacterium]HSA37005.1 L-threonylcarbamoyladenylate synthase [Candidatus Paceibacterota bacterium]